MSSWITRGKIPKRQVAAAEIKEYYATKPTSNIGQFFLNTLAIYIHSMRQGNPARVFDRTNILSVALKTHPQVIILKEEIQGATNIPYETIHGDVSKLKYSEIYKYSQSFLNFSNQTYLAEREIMNSASVKDNCDVGVDIQNFDAIPQYIRYIHSIKEMSPKAKIDVFLMAANRDIYEEFMVRADPSWRISTLCTEPNLYNTDYLFQKLAEIHIMSRISTLMLDYTSAGSRLIKLIHGDKSIVPEVVGEQAWYFL